LLIKCKKQALLYAKKASSNNPRLTNPGSLIILAAHPKLLPRWVGTFTIINRASRQRPNTGESGYSVPVAFKLDLQEIMQVHNVFHVSLLKPYLRERKLQQPPLSIVVDGEKWFDV